MAEVFYIGGSPCSGKSTIAEMLVEKYQLQYYKLDDHLDEYLQKGANDGHTLFFKIKSLSLDKTWLRDPLEQSNEEIAIYDAMLPYALQAIEQMPKGEAIVAEGTGFLPHLMKNRNVDRSHYVCIVPTRDFQLNHYSQRPWVSDYLSNCSDQERAFRNWMQRDALFADTAFNEAIALGYSAIRVDGKTSLEETFQTVENLFRL